MSQPIFAIKKSKVKEIVIHESKFIPIPNNFDWGKALSMQQMMDIIDSIKCTHDFIKMHDLHTAFQRLEVTKLLKNANRTLYKVLAICKSYREDLNKISVEQQ